MNIERDKDFEQLEDIAAMMTENPDIEFENGKYVYYGLDPRTAFAVVYIGGAWAGWQAKAQAMPGTYTSIVLALEDVQSKIAKASFLTMDVENENEVMAVDANEISAYIDELIEAQEPNQPTQFNLDDFLAMEEKLKHKGGVITADLDRFIAYAEMVLGKAKAQSVQNTNHVIKALEDHLSINLDSDREDDGHSYWSGYNVALSEVKSVMIEAQEPK